MSLVTVFDDFIHRYSTAYAEVNIPLLTEAHEDWQAPIYRQPEGNEAAAEELVHWQPILQQEPLQFDDLANALEQPFHPDIAIFYGRWFAADLNVEYDNHPLILLQNHCREDGERLQANLAGHVLMKRRLRQPITLFIGLAEESDDLLITVDNESGQVGLEFVGQPQHEILAPSLAAFIEKIKPRIVSEEME
ncbi:SecY-interacting protein [Pseudidiomarina andamanensis]|uniref:Protein Syd n=1 Tax=Pseudidiomarina andamanensis TaxID=1940690 RepID=A0AA92IL44_9GAMM|nr:SecY-interacting protein [Pseudidiomarina andamanensis]MDS0218166.1 SecY-interacting protein [Pseudidiomarina andamanensis]QGT95053.1 SecY-interacting protein [Pseudidiomarina andamanensis]